MAGTTPEWDARSYHRLSEPQLAWGLEVLARLPLSGGETVMDAGCGSGRLTEKLLEKLPTGRVLAVDLSKNMLARAAEHLAPWRDRVDFLEADLAKLSLPAEVDAVFSTATFHWVPDHDALFASLLRALRPGGRLVAQFGGRGNLSGIRRRAAALLQRPHWRPHFEGFEELWHYPGAEETAARLTRAGFTSVRAWLQPAPTRFPDAETFRAFCRGVVARVYLSRLPQEPLRERFLEELLSEEALEARQLDYVRLNVEAIRP